MGFRYCDEMAFGFSWLVEESMTRTSHALAADGCVWLVDPVAWPDAIERVRTLGEPQAVLQLLDRHNRDCAAVAGELGVPHHRVPPSLPGTPFSVVRIASLRWWQEVALWWPERRALVVADALGTNRFFTGGLTPLGVHPLLRFRPPDRALGDLRPEHVLVGHGAGSHGREATAELAQALARSRRDLPRLLLRLARPQPRPR